MTKFGEKMVACAANRSLENNVANVLDGITIEEIGLGENAYTEEARRMISLSTDERSEEFNRLYEIASKLWEDTGDLKRIEKVDIVKLVNNNIDEADKVYRICKEISMMKAELRKSEEEAYLKSLKKGGRDCVRKKI